MLSAQTRQILSSGDEKSQALNCVKTELAGKEYTECRKVWYLNGQSGRNQRIMPGEADPYD